MVDWRSEEQIGRLFVVGSERLLSYASRGNLSFRKLPGGSMQYDLAQVARFFAPRQARSGDSATSPATGRLGTLRVGERLGPPRAASATIERVAPTPPERETPLPALSRSASRRRQTARGSLETTPREARLRGERTAECATAKTGRSAHLDVA